MKTKKQHRYNTLTLLRKKQLEREPNCRSCGAKATDVDHIFPWNKAEYDEWQDVWVTDRGLSMHGKENLQSLCYDCHREKTTREFVEWGQRNKEAKFAACGVASLRKSREADRRAHQVQLLYRNIRDYWSIQKILKYAGVRQMDSYGRRKLDENGKSYPTRKWEAYFAGDITYAECKAMNNSKEGREVCA